MTENITKLHKMLIDQNKWATITLTIRVTCWESVFSGLLWVVETRQKQRFLIINQLNMQPEGRTKR